MTSFLKRITCGGSQQGFTILTIILISWWIQLQGVESASPEEKVYCRFRNKEYSPGDSWVPASTTSYGSNCIICTCLQTGRLNCTKQACPEDCSPDTPPHLAHPCCKMCAEPGDSSSSSSSAGGGGPVLTAAPSSGEEEDEDTDLVTENSEFVSCLHQGKIYRDGDSFTANVSGLPIQAMDQCMQCVCQTGMVLCQMKACSSFKCSSSGSGSSSRGFSLTSSFGGGAGATQATIEACCQRCAAWRKPRSEANTQSSYPPPPTANNSWNNGHSAARVRSPNHDSSSHRFGDGTTPPVTRSGSSPSFGSLESSITFRDGGGVSGGGLDNLIPSSASTRDKTSQGDDCVSAGRYYSHGSSWHPSMGPFGPMECVSCTCSRGQIDCGRLKCPPKKELPCPKPLKVEGHCCPICTSSMSNDGSKMCVPERQEVTALRSHGIGLNNTEHLNFAFIKQRPSPPSGGGGVVDLHEWTLSSQGEISGFSTKYISLPDWNEIKTRRIFTTLGATNEKNLDKFTRREKKLEKRCVTRCSGRISSLERSLRIHRLVARKSCLSHERLVANN